MSKIALAQIALFDNFRQDSPFGHAVLSLYRDEAAIVLSLRCEMQRRKSHFAQIALSLNFDKDLAFGHDIAIVLAIHNLHREEDAKVLS